MRVWRDSIKLEPDENGMATQWYLRSEEIDLAKENIVIALKNLIPEQLVVEKV